MKHLLYILFLCFSHGLSIQANETTTTSISSKNIFIADGYKMELSVSPGINIVNPSNDYRIQSGLIKGYSIGFESVKTPNSLSPVKNIGYSGGLTLQTGEMDKSTNIGSKDFTLFTLDINLNYSINEKFYALTGLESTSFAFNKQLVDTKFHGLGLRIGAGYNISESFAVTYVVSHKSLDFDRGSAWGSDSKIGQMDFTMGQLSAVLRF